MASTQDALYRRIDLDLSWSERDLPERERTKHVHRLHPYLGKFIPQLVEALLARHVRPAGACSTRSRARGRRSCRRSSPATTRPASDVAAFNCLLMRVKTREYNPFVLESRAARRARAARARSRRARPRPVSRYVRDWYAPQAAAELLFFRGLVEDYEHADVLRVVLARAARSARRTTHFDLDFPRTPQRDAVLVPQAPARVPAGRRGAPRSCAATRSTRSRGSRSSRACACAARGGRCSTATRASSTSAARFDGVVTSPPYPGLIDYHEQHRYAYELLGLEECRELELGKRLDAGGARAAYVEGVAAVLANVRGVRCGRRAPVVIVINDRRELYPEILERAGLRLEERYRRHVNRRTGRRAGEFYEDVLVARAESSLRHGSSQTRDGLLPSVTTCSHAPSPTRLSGSTPAASRSRRTCSAACRRLRSSGLPTAPARRRSNASAAGSRRPSSSGRARRITVNLAPAELRKEGSGFDLPIALAVLAASRQVPPRGAGRARGGRRARAGRTAAAGRRCVRRGRGRAAVWARRLLCAAECAAEAALAGIEPVPVHHLAEAVPTCAASGSRLRPTSRAVAAERRRAGRAGSRRRARPGTRAGARSSWRRRAVTTCCSAGRPERARRCSRGDFPGSCRGCRRTRRSR